MKVRAHILVALCVAGNLGCLEHAEDLLQPAPGATGALGERGRHGVRLFQRVLRARVDQGISTEIFLPTDSEGLAPGPWPVAVFVQGGLVELPRYRWLGAHIASRGYAVLSPQHVLNLAFFDQGNGLGVLRAARRSAEDGSHLLHGRIDPNPALIAGHSLGGVVASKAWLSAPDELSHLVLLASVPDPADDSAARHDGRVLSIAGGRDGRIGPEEVEAGARAYAAPTSVAVVEGMNHYQFTDAASEDELASDLEPEVGTDTARRRALYLLDAMLEDLRALGELGLPDSERWPEGLHERPLEAS